MARAGRFAVCAGRDAVDALERLVRARDPKVVGSDRAFANHLAMPNIHKVFANALLNMRWKWFGSGEHDFIIGDDPVCRLGLTTGRYDTVLRALDLQITVPLSRKLTLQMSYWDESSDVVEEAWADSVKALNRRQIINALEFVYGPTEVALPKQT